MTRDGDAVTVDGGVGVRGGAPLHAADLDLTTAASSPPRSPPSPRSPTVRARVTGIGHLRGHETDRLAALATEINGSAAR